MQNKFTGSLRPLYDKISLYISSEIGSLNKDDGKWEKIT